MKGIETMKMKFADSELEYELLNGEYRRYKEHDGNENAEYLCVGLFNTNKVLFQYIDTLNEPVDFVQSVISNIPEYAMDYLVGVLNKNNNIFIRLTFYPGEPTGFEIYYDCDCKENDINSLIKWMNIHNDFAATEYAYTEIINGHQKHITNK